jgi:uncharacterized integral membrane protein
MVRADSIKGGRKMNIKWGIILVLTGFMIIFIIQNVAAVEVTFFSGAYPCRDPF